MCLHLTGGKQRRKHKEGSLSSSSAPVTAGAAVPKGTGSPSTSKAAVTKHDNKGQSLQPLHSFHFHSLAKAPLFRASFFFFHPDNGITQPNATRKTGGSELLKNKPSKSKDPGGR